MLKALPLLLLSASALAGTVGGTITGLTAPMVLRMNVTTRAIGAGATTFAFNTTVPEGSAYVVYIGIQPAGQNCVIANGNGVMGPTNVTNITITCVNLVPITLNWTKPTLNTDGTPLTDLTGYRVYYGATPSTISTTRSIPSGNTLSSVFNLPQGYTYYFQVASVSASGGVGPKSNIAVK